MALLLRRLLNRRLIAISGI